MRRLSILVSSGRWGAWLALLGLAGCIEAYMPEVISANASYLVVDGFINGNGRTRIKLSRTENIAATTAPPAEKGARLFIADNAGTRYPLAEASSGYYVSDSLLLPAGRQYQLLIATSGAGSSVANYASDLVPLLQTPPIDQVRYRLADNQVQLLLDTHDATGQTRYYRWKVSETWQFNSAYVSHLEYRGGIVQDRITPIYTCWRTEVPSAIRQGSSAALSQPVLTDVALLSPAVNSERFKIRYSVGVAQYAETAEEFSYYEVLRKNTEAVGTVNDPLPSQLTGNVHRTDKASEPVLGFVGAHTAQFKRLFINRQDLPLRNDKDFDTPYNNCMKQDTAEILAPYAKMDKSAVVYPHTVLFVSSANVPIDLIYALNVIPGFPVYGYSGSSADCVDCRVRGSNVKPSFW